MFKAEAVPQHSAAHTARVEPWKTILHFVFVES
jgi:hypothetical protein